MARIVPAKAKKREGFQSSSSSAMARSSGAKPEKKKYQRPECSYPYCETLAVRGGMCRKHGVKRICSAEGCWRQVQQGGVCIFHGAVVNRKECEMEGCTTAANQYGFCGKHGGYTRCRESGCEKRALKGGWCLAHGGVSYTKPCLMEGCATLAHVFGYCCKHGGYYRCKQDGCEKKAREGGLCIAHFKSQEED